MNEKELTLEEIDRKILELLHIKMIRKGGQSKKGFDSLDEDEKYMVGFLEEKFYGKPNDYCGCRGD